MNGKNAPLWLKILSVLLAVSLGGGYVGWRNQQAERRAASPPASTKSEDPLLMVGSKSPGRDVLNLEFKDTPGEESLITERELMSSSKSMIATEFLEIGESNADDFLLPQIEEPEPEPAPRTVLPSSKSGVGILEPPVPEDSKGEMKEP